MTDQERSKLLIYATDEEKICEIEDIKTHNDIEEIKILKIVQSESLVSMEGLDKFRNLIDLDLSCNKIFALTEMDNLHDLRFLDLSCNQLTDLDGFGNLFNLEKIVLSHNKISNLKGLQNLSYSAINLKYIDLKDNLISSLNQIVYLEKLNLETLILNDKQDTNPICSLKNYVEFIKERIPSLLTLDNQRINTYDRSNIHLKRSAVSMVTTKAKTQKSSHLLNKQNNYNTVKNNLPQTQIENNNSQYSGLQFPYDTKYKFFKNEIQNLQNTNPNLYKDQLRSLQNNIEELFKDQKDLIFKYEKNENYWSSKLDDMISANKELKEKNQSYLNRFEDAQFELKEALNKISLKEHENVLLKRGIEEKDNNIMELSNKISVLKGDLEFSKNEGDRANKKFNELGKELEELKKEKYSLKEQLSKSEGFYKEIFQKKQEEDKEKMKIIANLESKLYEVSKTVSEKQNEIENLLEKNNFLNNQIKKIKNEVQNEIIPLKEKEMEEEVKKLKSVISELENNFKKILSDKDMEFISDIKSLEKKYNEVFEEQSSKTNEAKKEIDRLNKALTDCKELLKTSLINEEKNEKKIGNLERDVENLRQEKERCIKIGETSIEELKQKIKILELEVRDQNEIILKNENLMKNYKKTLCNKDDEFNTIFEESSRLKNTISQLQVTIDKLEKDLGRINDEKRNLTTKINTDTNLLKIEELEEVIKTKNHIINDQLNQINDLKRIIEDRENEINNFSQEKEKIKKKYEKRMKEISHEKEIVSEDCKNRENQIAELEENFHSIKQEIENLMAENQSIKEENIKKDKIISEVQNEFLLIKNKSNNIQNELNMSNDRIKKYEDSIEELKKCLIMKNEENKEILKHFEKFRDEKIYEIQQCMQKISEQENEIILILTENEKQKQMIKNVFKI